MKPEEKEGDNDELVTGDVIGDTVYSERFVLKLLLKFANLDTLKDELIEKSFEEDLCTLWDMTAERDVVGFLQKHNSLNLFQFALPIIDSQRVIEIVIGIIANMCCAKEVVDEIYKMSNFFQHLISYINSDDSLIIIQVLRLVNYCVLLSEETQLTLVMELFETSGYSKALYFILSNSLNKDLIINAFENLNTLCSQCNIDKTRNKFFTQFVTKEAVESMWSAFNELLVHKKHSCEREECERILAVTLQIILNLVGFDKSSVVYRNNKKEVAQMMQHIVTYYEEMIIDRKVIDPDLVDIVDSVSTVKSSFQLGESCDNELFKSFYRMWKSLKSYNVDTSGFERDEEIDECIPKLMKVLSMFICKYMVDCNDIHLLHVLDKICENYDQILNDCGEEDLQTVVSTKTSDYRSRIKENFNS